jgi:hypothetical protein
MPHDGIGSPHKGSTGDDASATIFLHILRPFGAGVLRDGLGCLRLHA